MEIPRNFQEIREDVGSGYVLPVTSHSRFFAVMDFFRLAVTLTNCM